MTTSLPTVRLGWTDMLLTRVGFGAWAIGGGGWAYGWGDQDDTESIAAIRHAVESGVNWIDTAAVYGLGHSEEMVAAALAGLPEADRPYVFTKAGLVWDPADRTLAPRRAGDPASLRAEVEASLRRLRVERIDLYQMHWPAEDGTAVEDYWQAFLDLKREGKVRAIGLSNHDIYQLEAAAEIGNVDAIQPPFNLIHRDAADDVLLWARAHEAGAIVYSPMASGLLTGAFTAERAARLEPGDWRADHPDFAESRTTYLPLVRFRSPLPLSSWVTALLAVLDSAALFLALSPTSAPMVPARLCLRSGIQAFNRIARAMGIQVADERGQAHAGTPPPAIPPIRPSLGRPPAVRALTRVWAAPRRP